MELVRPLASLGRSDLALAGGKGANLGAMVQAGLPVPPGFVLLTSAYNLFVQQADIQAEIERLAGAVDADNQLSLDTASARIRTLFDQGAVPAVVTAAVTAAYAALGGGPVAVRSSATAEDLPDASFAGQQETYLNIVGADAVIQAARRCWSSLWTGRAISYRARNGIAPGGVALAVVVQQLVAAEAAGVLFTADPVSGRRDHMVIDGAWGLGEAVVSGSVSPDHWLADGRTGAVLSEQIAVKTVMVLQRPGGTEERPVPADRQGQPVLDAAQVAALVDLGRKTAARLGAPQDMEWALAGGQLHLLQSRPITTLFPLPEPPPPSGLGPRIYVGLGPLLGFLEPLTPAGLCAFRTLGEGFPPLLGLQFAPGAPAIFTVAAGRIFIDVTDILNTRMGGRLLGGTSIDATTSRALQDLLARDERLRPAGRGGTLPVAGVSKRKLLPLMARALAAQINPARAQRSARHAIEAYVGTLEEQSRRLRRLSDRVQFVRTALRSIVAKIPAMSMPRVAPALAARSLVGRKLAEWGLDPALLDAVGRSLPHNPTTEMDLALWRVSRTLLAAGAEPRADHPAVQDFLARYGHRAIREVDVGVPRWQEDPTHILNLLRTYMAQGANATDPEQHFAAGAAAAEQAIAGITAAVRRRRGALRAAIIGFALRRFRQLGGMREWHKFYLVQVLALARRVIRAAGAELVQEGRLDRVDDVFFVDLVDLETGRDLREVAARNRAGYNREMKRRLVPPVLTSEGEVSYGVRPARAGVLTGTGASAGVHEGAVRIIRDPLGATLAPGEILVAPGTDPAWTPLFLTAGALVTETGGMMSHGSVVAREYGIPAVVGIPGATDRLHTGQHVRVDGGSGTVAPLD